MSTCHINVYIGLLKDRNLSNSLPIETLINFAIINFILQATRNFELKKKTIIHLYRKMIFLRNLSYC